MFVKRIIIGLLILSFYSCSSESNQNSKKSEEFPDELVKFIPLKTDSIFAGTGGDTWDKMIRERGFILKEGSEWKLWYTGYNPDSIDTHFLGYATSADGINW